MKLLAILNKLLREAEIEADVAADKRLDGVRDEFFERGRERGREDARNETISLGEFIPRHKVHKAIWEAKTSRPITEQDVDEIARILDRLVEETRVAKCPTIDDIKAGKGGLTITSEQISQWAKDHPPQVVAVSGTSSPPQFVSQWYPTVWTTTFADCWLSDGSGRRL